MTGSMERQQKAPSRCSVRAVQLPRAVIHFKDVVKCAIINSDSNNFAAYLPVLSHQACSPTPS